MRTVIAAALAVALLLLPLASATEECESEVTVGADGVGYYFVDHDQCQPDCLVSLWVYSDDDPERCDDDEADTIIF